VQTFLPALGCIIVTYLLTYLLTHILPLPRAAEATDHFSPSSWLGPPPPSSSSCTWILLTFLTLDLFPTCSLVALFFLFFSTIVHVCGWLIGDCSDEPLTQILAGLGDRDPLKICRTGQSIFWPPRVANSFIQNRCWITVQVSCHQGRKTCVENGRKNYFFSRRLKQFDWPWPPSFTSDLRHRL